MSRRRSVRRAALAATLATAAALWSQAGLARATITVVNADAPGVGFNDPTPTAPVGGNPGTTIGEQRLNVFLLAAERWGGILSSSVAIEVLGSFAALPCTSGSATLGQAGPQSRHANFAGADANSVWYPQALANALARSDLASGTEDMLAFFNGGIDNNDSCLNGVNWYYGFDNQPPGNDVDFLNTIMHELAHGLGFAGFTDLTSGAYTGNPALPDLFALNTFDTDLGLLWTDMTNAQRQASATNNGDVVWAGANVAQIADEILSNGFTDGLTRLYTPADLRVGSSVYHFDESVSPNALMEPRLRPSLTAATNVDLTAAFMADIGWTIDDGDGDLVPDVNDNCSEAANATQRDTDGDNFGNLCDADFNNDLVVNFIDLGAMKGAFFSTDEDTDLNGDGQVNFLDLGLMKAAFFGVPGPSGLAP
ncbi:MAG: hypothetical protein AAGD86_00225 [Pseudomonadota bacterium]